MDFYKRLKPKLKVIQPTMKVQNLLKNPFIKFLKTKKLEFVKMTSAKMDKNLCLLMNLGMLTMQITAQVKRKALLNYSPENLKAYNSVTKIFTFLEMNEN